jgi:hypothetical protein
MLSPVEQYCNVVELYCIELLYNDVHCIISILLSVYNSNIVVTVITLCNFATVYHILSEYTHMCVMGV